MSDPNAYQQPIPQIPTSRRLVADPTTTADDDLAMARLATWLAEVSAEATQQPPESEAVPPTAELTR